MSEKKRITYSIGDTAKITNVSQKQIRDWEANGYIPKAERVVCGVRAYRWFSDADVAFIKKVKGFLDEGFTLPTAAKKARLNYDTKGGTSHA